MMRPNIRYASLDDLAAARLMRSLETHANPRLTLGSVILVTYTVLILLFTGWMLSGPPAQEKDCGIEGTDWYYECTTGEAVDLTPMIQDEADEPVSMERN